MANTKITEFLRTYFDEYLSKDSIFVNRDVLTDNYLPQNIKYRDKEIAEISFTLAPLLKKEKASNLLLFGAPGTGKTLCARFVSSHMINAAVKRNINFRVIYLNCRIGRFAKSEYYTIREIVRKLTGNFIKDGVRLEDLYNMLFSYLNKENLSVLIILDEIDKLVSNIKDDFLYFLTRESYCTNKNNLAFVGISNNLSFLDVVDPRVLSSLDANKIRFNPYNAVQLTEILKDRASLAFKSGVVSEEIIKYIAGWVAKESGDARKALSILKLAGEIADRENSNRITLDHVNEAIQRIDIDSFLSLLDGLVTHNQILLLAIINKNIENKEFATFEEVYGEYQKICESLGLSPLCKDTVSQKLKELKMIFEGYLEIEVVSFGRKGRKRIISLYLDNKKLKEARKTLEKILYDAG